jgi:hypothetical protein
MLLTRTATKKGEKEDDSKNIAKEDNESVLSLQKIREGPLQICTGTGAQSKK